ncbi:MAG: thrombospondin type 3 repeat-containing protein [Gammaproteobacteria bacterium]
MNKPHRIATMASCVLLGVASSALADVPLIFHSPANDGLSNSTAAITVGGMSSQVNLWLDGGATASSRVCNVEATGDEVCGYDILIEASGGVSLLSFSPASGVVAQLDGTQSLRANQIDIDAQTGPRPVGTLSIMASASGDLQLTGGVFVDAALTETTLSEATQLAITGTDSDADSVLDAQDNCTLAANPDQRDTDADGYGNRCDPDLNNDGIVNVIDLGLLRAEFFTANENADLNGDGVVNVVDLGLLRALFFAPPGPSGIVGGGV